MASDDVLDRETVEEKMGAWMGSGPHASDRDALLAHDAALRARIEELEAKLEDAASVIYAFLDGDEELAMERWADCITSDRELTESEKEYALDLDTGARRALESDHGEQDDGGRTD